MSELYVSSSPNSATLEAYVAEFISEYYELGVPQTLKARCRDVARAESALLVAPAPESQFAHFGKRASFKPCIWIVAKAGVLSSSEKVKEKLAQLDFRLKQKVKLNQTILQTCYTFTVIARLAPKWNMITRWLVQGSEFYTTAKASAIDFEASFTASDITLTLNVQRLSFSHLTVDDLGLTPIITNKFKKNPNYVINSKHISTNRCTVLPNLTTAYVYSASHHMTPSYKFPNYDALRLHWKKQHGIMLPEVQSLFYQIFFGHKSQNLFSYPACCVLKAPPLVYPERDTHLVTAAFVSDIHSRMPSLCGERITFSSQAFHATSDLTPASSSAVDSSSGHANLSLTPLSAGHGSSQHRPLGNNRGSIGLTPLGKENGDLNRVAVEPSTRDSASIPLAKRFCFSDPASGVLRPQTVPGFSQPVRNLFPATTSATTLTASATTPVAAVAAGSGSSGGGGGGHESAVVQRPKTITEVAQSKSLLSLVPTSTPITQVPENVIKQIGKSKNAELKGWLADKGVKYTSKMKKNDLMELVSRHISVTGCDYP